MSYKPAIKVFGEEPYYTNSQAFGTYDEAEKSARSRHWNWIMAESYRVEESDQPVNYMWDNEKGDVMLDKGLLS